MRPTVTVLAMLALLCLAPSTEIVNATQEGGSVYQQDTTVFRMVKLQHATAEEVAQQIGEILGAGCHVVTDERTNQIIIRAPKDTVERAIELIASMDVPVPTGSGNVTEMIRPRFRAVGELHTILNVHFQNRKDQYLVVDEARNTFVVKATPELIKEVRKTMEQLDAPLDDLSLEFLILGRSHTPLPDLPEMRKVSEELEGLGLEGYGVVSRAAVVAQETKQFSIEGNNQIGNLEVSGKVRTLSDQKAELSLQLSIRLQGEGTNPQRARGNQTSAQLYTTVKMPLGDLIILGISPASNQPDSPLVLVAKARKM